jgi:cysteine desulfurase
MIYLDGHSTTPLDPAVFEAMKPYYLERFGNASHGVHRYNWEAEAAVEKARTQLAKLVGAHEKEIIFTSGATESNHLALHGLVPYLKRVNRMKILSLEIEHASLLGPLEQLQEQGFKVEWIKTFEDGRVDLEDLKQKLGPDVGLVSIAYANHEIGTIQDIQSISKLVHASNAIFHSDAVQALGKIRFDVNTQGIDLMTLSAHKIHGPKGIGALYIRRKNPRVELEAVFWGGNQERGLRPGTPNSPGIVGFGQAAEILSQGMENEVERMRTLRDLLWSDLKTALPCLVRNGSVEHALPHNLNVSVVGVDGAALFGRLKNVAVSNASACVNGTQDYSQVLTVLGVNKEMARSTLRFGLGRFTTKEEIMAAAQEVAMVVNELRQMEKEFAEQSGLGYKNGECLK